jgi:hypothetical protein
LYALALVSAAQGLSLLDRQILSILAPRDQADLKIGDAELGLLYGTLFSLFYALFSLPLGRAGRLAGLRTQTVGDLHSRRGSVFAGLSAFRPRVRPARVLACSGVGVGEGRGRNRRPIRSFSTRSRAERRGTGDGGDGRGHRAWPRLSMTLGGVGRRAGGTPNTLTGAFGFSGWQFAFLVAALPGRVAGVGDLPPARTAARRYRRHRLAARPGAVQGQRDRARRGNAGGQLAVAVEPQGRGPQWLINIVALVVIVTVCVFMARAMQAYSPRPDTPLFGLSFNAHELQWFVVGFGAFVILNLFQNLKLVDRPAYNVILSPSLLLLMVVGGLQTSINYGVMGFTPSYLVREFGLSQAETGCSSACWPPRSAWAAGHRRAAERLADQADGRARPGVADDLLARGLAVPQLLALRRDRRDQLLLALHDLQHRPDAVAAAGLFALLRPRAAAHARDHQLDVHHRLDAARPRHGPYFVGIVSDKNGGDLARRSPRSTWSGR